MVAKVFSRLPVGTFGDSLSGLHFLKIYIYACFLCFTLLICIFFSNNMVILIEYIICYIFFFFWCGICTSGNVNCLNRYLPGAFVCRYISKNTQCN